LNKRGLEAVLLIISLVGGVYVGFLYLQQNSPSSGNANGLQGLALADYVRGRTTRVVSLSIEGNSSDVIYPELSSVTFVPQSSGEWQVTAHILDDSQGPYNLTIYERAFLANSTEVELINSALYDGLSLTYTSNDSVTTITHTGSIAFTILICYDDGTWIYLLKLLTVKGHIILLSGTGTPDLNLINGDLFEPGFALDGLVLAMNGVFVHHLG
jgi:hypothetical protein